jgi:hypothetical protein
MKYYKVEGHANLIRDDKTKAILNTNESDYENYIRKREIKKNEDERISSLENNVNMIKSDLDEIKNLLRSLANES